MASALGREPAGAFRVVVRDAAGRPAVIENAPFLDDGRPMPTSFWLVDPELRRAVATLESAGGVRRAEADVDRGALAEAHRRYAEQRDRVAEQLGPAPGAVGEGATRARPSGGVGGTRQGVKCLHAHLAWWLAGGDDPVGAWTAAHLEPPLRRPVDGALAEEPAVARPEAAAVRSPASPERAEADQPPRHEERFPP